MVQATDNVGQPNDQPPGTRASSGCAARGSREVSAQSSERENGAEKTLPTTAVRFGYLRYIGEFTHSPELRFMCGAKLVIQTKRGIEIGEQAPFTCQGCDKAVARERVKEWTKHSGEDSFIFDAGRVLREATAADLAEYARIQEGGREKIKFCQQVADRRSLSIRVVESECPFGGERLIFYFTAPERIDFRAIVKDLAREYRTRIEMRQIGARDEARLLADYETCGREVCCKVFLKSLKPISMRMAKLQKATLDPTQVSGRCGRLKCCLRYEHVGYDALDKQLPKTGAHVHTSHGDGVVVARQVLTQLLQIRTEADRVVTVVAEELIDADAGMRQTAPEPQAAGAGDERGGRPGRTANRESRRGRKPPRPLPARAPPDRKHEAQSEPANASVKTAPAEKLRGTDQTPRARRRRGRRRRGKRRRGPATGGASQGS